MTVRILVTGSRDWTNTQKFNDTMHIVRQQFPNTEDWLIVHGDCPDGLDALADAWAKVRGIDREAHPAIWSEHGRTAGFRRNSEMVALGAEVCLAFMCPCTKRNCRKSGKAHGSHGTTHCSIEARKAGIPVWTIRDKWPE